MFIFCDKLFNAEILMIYKMVVFETAWMREAPYEMFKVTKFVYSSKLR